jgi:hypothetical protein
MQLPPVQRNTKSVARDDYDEDEYRSHEGCRSSIRLFGSGSLSSCSERQFRASIGVADIYDHERQSNFEV